MEVTLSADSYFSTPNPAAIELPHLLTALDAELLGEITHLTVEARRQLREDVARARR